MPLAFFLFLSLIAIHRQCRTREAIRQPLRRLFLRSGLGLPRGRQTHRSANHAGECLQPSAPPVEEEERVF